MESEFSFLSVFRSTKYRNDSFSMKLFCRWFKDERRI